MKKLTSLILAIAVLLLTIIGVQAAEIKNLQSLGWCRVDLLAHDSTEDVKVLCRVDNGEWEKAVNFAPLERGRLVTSEQIGPDEWIDPQLEVFEQENLRKQFALQFKSEEESKIYLRGISSSGPDDWVNAARVQFMSVDGYFTIQADENADVYEFVGIAGPDEAVFTVIVSIWFPADTVPSDVSADNLSWRFLFDYELCS